MFRVGQQVVCVDGDANPGFCWKGNEAVIRGEIYTVRSIFLHPKTSKHMLRLAEVQRSDECKLLWGHDGYAATRFRPIVSRPTSIEFAHEILRKATRTDEVSV